MTEEVPKKAKRAERIKAAHNGLDRAVSEYIEVTGLEGIVTSWIIAVGTASIERGVEYDGFKSSSSEGISRWTAIGLLRTALKSAENDGFIHTQWEGTDDE